MIGEWVQQFKSWMSSRSDRLRVDRFGIWVLRGEQVLDGVDWEELAELRIRALQTRDYQYQYYLVAIEKGDREVAIESRLLSDDAHSFVESRLPGCDLKQIEAFIKDDTGGERLLWSIQQSVEFYQNINGLLELSDQIRGRSQVPIQSQAKSPVKN